MNYLIFIWIWNRKKRRPMPWLLNRFLIRESITDEWHVSLFTLSLSNCSLKASLPSHALKQYYSLGWVLVALIFMKFKKKVLILMYIVLKFYFIFIDLRDNITNNNPFTIWFLIVTNTNCLFINTLIIWMYGFCYKIKIIS